MSDDLYERYKRALRTGHVAVLRGHLADALTAYREAAAIAPDRALPHTSLGGVLLRLGHVDEALFEYDAALVRAPRDEAVLLGRAEALVAAHRPADAAASLDAAAEIQETSGRVPEAADTVRRALDLEATAARRERHAALLASLQPPAVADTELELHLRPLDAGEGVAADVGEVAAEAGTESAIGANADAAAASPPEVDATDEHLDVADSDAISRTDLARLEESAANLDDLDPASATATLVALVRARGGAGLPDAALDAAQLALALSPGDPAVHLALVDLYAARGWDDLAVEKLLLLTRLAELSGDAEARAGIVRAAAQFEDARLETLLG